MIPGHTLPWKHIQKWCVITVLSITLTKINLNIKCFKYFPGILNAISSCHIVFSFPMIGSLFIDGAVT